MAREPDSGQGEHTLPAWASLLGAFRSGLGKRRGAGGGPPPVDEDALDPPDPSVLADPASAPSRVRVNPDPTPRARAPRRKVPVTWTAEYVAVTGRSLAQRPSVWVALALAVAAAWLGAREWERREAARAAASRVAMPAVAQGAAPSFALGEKALRQDTLKGYAEAVRLYDEASRAGGGPLAEAGGIEARSLQARLQGRLLDPDVAARAESLVQRFPGATDVERAYAFALIGTGRAAAATPVLVGLVERHPQDARAWLGMGLWSLAAGHGPDVAIGHLSRAIEEDPDLVVARAELASLYARTGRRDEAREQRTRVLELSPAHRMKARR